MTTRNRQMDRGPTAGGVGYDVTITRRHFYIARDDWRVHVRRLSDGAEIARTFEWRWAARRWARSPRRLGRAFGRADSQRSDYVERFVLRWPE